MMRARPEVEEVEEWPETEEEEGAEEGAEEEEEEGMMELVRVEETMLVGIFTQFKFNH